MRTYSLSGIFIRTPRDITPESWTAGQEDWMFISIGAGDEVGVPKFEVKNTVESQSILELTPADTGWTELRLQRLDDVYTVTYRLDGDSDWTSLRTYGTDERPVMPQTLQVGLVAYTDWSSISQFVNDPFSYKTQVIDGNPDLYSFVDYIRFARPSGTSNEQEERVSDFTLNQNYPNPFNPSTVISYKLSVDSHVELKVFDLLGREMTSLVNSRMPAGNHNVTFNAEGLASGMYYYQLITDGQLIQTRKMMLVR